MLPRKTTIAHPAPHPTHPRERYTSRMLVCVGGRFVTQEGKLSSERSEAKRFRSFTEARRYAIEAGYSPAQFEIKIIN